MLNQKVILLVGYFVLVGLVAGCEEDDSPGLNEDHDGYGNPGCFGTGCHTKNDTHHADLQPYQCVECHGKNGAPASHSDRVSCGECHENQHGNEGFPDPESCRVCH